MAGPLFVGAEDVILKPDFEHYGASQPVMEGIELVSALRRFPTSRVVVHCHTQDNVSAEFFMRVNGLNEIAVVTTRTIDLKEALETAQWHAFQRQRAQGPVALVLTASPQVFNWCCGTHQAVLLYGRRGKVGSAPEQQSWDELQESVRRQREAEADRSSEPSY